MGSPITQMLGNAAGAQAGAQVGGGLGVGGQSPELAAYCAANPQDTSLCPPQEQPQPDPTQAPPPQEQPVAVAPDQPPQNISQFEVPGQVQELQGIGAQLTPEQQLQASIGQGADKYNQMMGPQGLPGYEASQPGAIPAQGQSGIADMLMKLLGGR